MYCNLLETGKPLASTDSPVDVPDHACRPDCGACCIAPSITTPIPGMPHGKPAGVRCVQLSDDMRCRIFGSPERPACCSGLNPQTEMCGDSRDAALMWLTTLEAQTRPSPHYRGARALPA
ncbi:YkgJ family cysteine cluster protein [Paraburkholderia kururiensis]|uniref:YkgJ family cysteine cluster protein n=1 Tax=Paraburkholderia kururiensis TaxID=984307 RepID=A0ABZ0WUE2_9BURK|nr:YkgJ family cysteine cluster protein [Paraburkholderia kururiensis]WQD81027.1 YkgJ family cysteine cluster protein [Paraburkholderia kururiensis]